MPECSICKLLAGQEREAEEASKAAKRELSRAIAGDDARYHRADSNCQAANFRHLSALEKLIKHGAQCSVSNEPDNSPPTPRAVQDLFGRESLFDPTREYPSAVAEARQAQKELADRIHSYSIRHDPMRYLPDPISPLYPLPSGIREQMIRQDAINEEIAREESRKWRAYYNRLENSVRQIDVEESPILSFRQILLHPLKSVPGDPFKSWLSSLEKACSKVSELSAKKDAEVHQNKPEPDPQKRIRAAAAKKRKRP